MDLPPRNQLIPTQFDLLPPNESLSAKPTLLQAWDHKAELWYKKDDQFKRPKAYISLRLFSGDCRLGRNLTGKVFADIWLATFMEYIREFNYQADMAALSFNMVLGVDHLAAEWSGYSETIPKYVRETFMRLKQFKVADVEEIFEQAREKYQKDCLNHYKQ